MDAELINIFQQVSEGGIPNVDMDTNLINAGLDSVRFIKLIVAVEEYFDIEVEDDFLDIAILSTLGDIKKQVEKHKANYQ